MFSKRRERLALMSATILFAVFGFVQLWRAFAQVPVSLGDQQVPLWPSFLIGAIALSMALWLGLILRSHRPLV